MHLRCGDKTLDLTRPIIMGVLNVTPDSFSDGGRFTDVDTALDHARRMVDEGAAIIDVGGESTRPGAEPVPVGEELRRVLPIVEALAGHASVVVSVDTSKPEVMRAVADAGAGMINDVRALSVPGALETAAGTRCGVCLMHMQGDPRTMQKEPTYREVVGDVRSFLARRIEACRFAGFAMDRIAVDPGFGFGKTLEHNLELLRRLQEIADLGVPLIAGLSRKSMLSGILGRSVDERLYGSLALAAIAVVNGARIVRTHDVAATRDAVLTAAAIYGDPRK